VASKHALAHVRRRARQTPDWNSHGTLRRSYATASSSSLYSLAASPSELSGARLSQLQTAAAAMRATLRRPTHLGSPPPSSPLVFQTEPRLPSLEDCTHAPSHTQRAAIATFSPPAAPCRFQVRLGFLTGAVAPSPSHPTTARDWRAAAPQRWPRAAPSPSQLAPTPRVPPHE